MLEAISWLGGLALASLLGVVRVPKVDNQAPKIQVWDILGPVGATDPQG
jgi:hypothetical protein